MFKKLALLSVMLSLGACETINQASQCVPEKNYIRVNKNAMDQYKKSFVAGEIKNFYFEESPAEPCYTDLCVGFDFNKINFMEKNFNDNSKVGVYTIRATKELNNPNCMEKNPASINNKNKVCYILEKNEKNIIKSQYRLKIDHSNTGQIIISFYDIKNNIELYQESYQTYSTGAIGAYGLTSCKINGIYNHDFNVLQFPTQSN